jgi:hypothetical protein
MSVASNNAALAGLINPAISVIRDTAEFQLIEAGEAANTVWRLSGSYLIDSTLTANSAALDIRIGETAATTDGVRVTLPRDGGTVLAAAIGTTNAVANLLFWQSGASEYQHFVVNVTLRNTAATGGWKMVLDPMLTDGSPLVAITGKKTPLIIKGLTFTRTS